MNNGEEARNRKTLCGERIRSERKKNIKSGLFLFGKSKRELIGI